MAGKTKEDLQTELATVTAQRDGLQQSEDALHSQLEASEAALKAKGVELEAAQKSLKAATASNDKLKIALELADKQVARFQGAAATAEDLAEELKGAYQKIEQTELLNADLTKRIASFDASRPELALQEREALQGQIDTLKDERSQGDEKLEAANARIDELQGDLANATSADDLAEALGNAEGLAMHPVKGMCGKTVDLPGIDPMNVITLARNIGGYQSQGVFMITRVDDLLEFKLVPGMVLRETASGHELEMVGH